MPERMFPDELIVIGKMSEKHKRELRRELKRWAEENNYAFLDMMLDLMD